VNDVLQQGLSKTANGWRKGVYDCANAYLRQEIVSFFWIPLCDKASGVVLTDWRVLLVLIIAIRGVQGLSRMVRVKHRRDRHLMSYWF
jgi:hypothetical protein